MLCSKCGARTRRSDHFCARCGTMLTARAQAEAQIDTPGAAPATPDKAQPAATKIIVGIVTLAAIAVYFAVFHDRLARDDTFDSPSDEHIRAAKDAVRALMRDPDSVTFGHISRCTGDHVMLTGTYNAKKIGRASCRERV